MGVCETLWMCMIHCGRVIAVVGVCEQLLASGTSRDTRNQSPSSFGLFPTLGECVGRISCCMGV